MSINKNKIFLILSVLGIMTLVLFPIFVSPQIVLCADTDAFEEDVCEFYAYVEYYHTPATLIQSFDGNLNSQQLQDSIELGKAFFPLADETDDLDYYIGIGEGTLVPDNDYTEEELLSYYGGYTSIFNASDIANWNTTTSAMSYADSESKFSGNRYYVGGDNSPNRITEKYALSQAQTFVNISTFQVLTFAKGIDDLSFAGIGFHTSTVSTISNSIDANILSVLTSAFFPILQTQTKDQSILGKVVTTVTRPLNNFIELTGNIASNLLNKPSSATHYASTTVPSGLLARNIFASASQFSLTNFLKGLWNKVFAILGGWFGVLVIVGLSYLLVVRRMTKKGKKFQLIKRK